MAELVAGLFPGAATALKFFELAAKVAEAAPTVYQDLTTASPIITRLVNSGIAIMTEAGSKKPVDPQTLAARHAYVDAAQSAYALGLPFNSPVALAQFPALAQGHETLFG